MVSAQPNDVLRKTTQLSFPQVKRVGNPSNDTERFQNDKLTNECGFTYDLLGELRVSRLVKILFSTTSGKFFQEF
jgi:hypothetical protein